MMSCLRARSVLFEHLRGAVGEAVLLQLDVHLTGCEDCRLERARLSTVGALRDWQPPSLSAAARARIVQKLVAHHPEAEAESESAMVPARSRRAPRVALLFGALAAAAAALLVWSGGHAPLARMAPRAMQPIAKAGSQHWDRAGTLQFLDAKLAYHAGTAANLQPEARTVALEAGELDVTGDAQAPLRIVTPRFVVTIRQAHAVFAADAVRVLDGQVEVYSLDERRLATVPAGQTWRPEPAPAVVPVAPKPAHEPAPALSVATALERARAALAQGDAPAARRFAHQALAAAPDAHDRAEAELFLAESHLVEQDSDRAVAAYRKVAASYPNLPEGESAAFAAAQVLSERGEHAGAAEALRAYVARYPEGRFAREANERLAELAPSVR